MEHEGQEPVAEANGTAVPAHNGGGDAPLALPIIYFDLETTSLSRTSEIIQLGAVYGTEVLN